MNNALLIIAPDAGGTGSVAGVVRNHARELANYRSVVLIAATVPDEPIDGVNCVRASGSSFRFLRRFAHVPREMASIYAAWRMARQVCRQHSVSALLVHSQAEAAWIGQRIRREFKIPFLLVVHADIHDRPQGTYDPLLTKFYRWVTPIAYRHADHILAISRHIAKTVIQHGADPKRICVVPNGISAAEIGLHNPTLPDSVSDQSSNPVLHVLYVGRLSIEKGVADLLTACGYLRKRQTSFKLKMVGNGPLKPELERQAADLELESYVSFTKGQPRQKLGAFYQQADVTCVPSLSEPQGIVVLESLIAGTPVVGTTAGGIPDMLQDGVNGRLYPVGDAKRLANILAELAADRPGLAQLSKAARQSVEAAYSWDVIGQNIYANVKAIEKSNDEK